MSATGVYRNEARRLRQQYAGQPEALHAKLRLLSERHDRAQVAARPDQFQRHEPCTAGPQAVPTHRSPDSAFARAVVSWFADQVSEQLQGRLLHHSQRQELLQTAERLGIGRFHANLIIAVAQNAAGNGRATSSYRLAPEHRRPRWRMVLLSAVIVQSLIVWGAWHVLYGLL